MNKASEQFAAYVYVRRHFEMPPKVLSEKDALKMVIKKLGKKEFHKWANAYMAGKSVTSQQAQK
jgi:hypothetical protein